MNDLDRQIRAHVEAFVDEITKLVRKAALDAVSDALGGKVAAPKVARPTRARKAADKGRKRSPKELEKVSASILLFLEEHQGSGAIQIARGLGVATKDLVLPVKKLLSAGTLTSKGQKRATKYYRKK